MKLKKKKGIYYVSFRTAEGTKEVSTRCTNKVDAERVCENADVEKMEALVKANALREDIFFKMKGGAKTTSRCALDHFAEWSDTIGKSERTIQETTLHVEKFLEAKRLSGKMPVHITERHITDHINNNDVDLKASTRRIMLSAITNFMRYCKEKGWVQGNPAKLVRVNMKQLSHAQKESKTKQVFTDSEIEWMLAMTEGFWNLAIHLAYETGLRIGDICRLEVASHNHKESSLAVWTEKRDKRVEIPVSEPLNRKLCEWDGGIGGLFFPSHKLKHEDTGKRSYHSVIFRRILNALGIDGKSFHSLRATYATNASINGRPWWEIAKDMGHSNVATTRVYIKDNKPVAEVA